VRSIKLEFFSFNNTPLNISILKLSLQLKHSLQYFKNFAIEKQKVFHGIFAKDLSYYFYKLLNFFEI